MRRRAVVCSTRSRLIGRQRGFAVQVMLHFPTTHLPGRQGEEDRARLDSPVERQPSVKKDRQSESGKSLVQTAFPSW